MTFQGPLIDLMDHLIENLLIEINTNTQKYAYIYQGCCKNKFLFGSKITNAIKSYHKPANILTQERDRPWEKKSTVLGKKN